MFVVLSGAQTLIGSAFIISAVMEVVKQTFQFAKQNGKHLSCFGFFFSSICRILVELFSEMLNICLFVRKHYLFGTRDSLQSLISVRCIRMRTE